METARKTKLLRSGFTVLFAGLMCAGSFMSYPLPGGVPMTVQNMFAALSGLVLGGLQGAGAVGLFLVLGLAGIPIFSGMQGGLAVIQGHTGGYLIGYFVGAFVGGLILGSPLKKEKKNTAFLVRAVVAVFLAYALQYAVGIPWFSACMEAQGQPKSFSQILDVAFLPFIVVDSIKLLISFMLTLLLRPVVARYLYPDDEKEAEEILRKLERRRQSGLAGH